MGIRAKQITASTFDSTEVGRVFAAQSIAGSKIVNGDINTTQLANNAVTSDKIATSAVSNGLQGGGGSPLAVKPDVSTGGNVVPVDVTANGVGLDVSDIDNPTGGIEANGGALRLTTQGAGIAGGGGTTLSLQTNTDTFAPTFSGSGAWSYTADRLQVTTDPDSDNDAVRKAYVDSVVQGLDVHESVRLATTQDPGFEGTGGAYSATGGTSARGQITFSTGPTSLDGVSLVNGDRILIKDGGNLNAVGTDAVAEVHGVDTEADSSGSLNNDYWVFYTTPNLAYYVWYNVNSGGSDPAPSAPAGVTYKGIEVAIATDATAAAVATATKSAIDSALRKTGESDPIDVASTTIGGAGNHELTVTNLFGGSVTNVADGTTGWSGFATDVAGTGLGPATNGLWVRTSQNTWDRATDFDEDIEAAAGDFTFVEEGTNWDNSGWIVTCNNPIAVGGAAGEPICWTQFSGAGQITAGSGLSKTGNTINVGDVNKGVQVNTDDLEIDASEIAGDGLKAGASTWLLAVEPNDFAGTGLEDDGADNLRIASSAAGNGLTGGGGSALSVQPNTTDDGAQPGLEVAANGLRISTGAAGTGLTGGGGSALSFDATAVDGNGLVGSGSSLAVDPDSETGGNIQPVNVTANGVGVDINAIAGNGLEADGSANLRVKADTGTGGDTAPVTVGANGVGLDVTTLDGDHLDIDFTPAYYTPDAGPAEAADVDDLAAHLKGIDTALASAGGTERQEVIAFSAADATATETGDRTIVGDTLDNTPVSALSVKIFLNGVLQEQGTGKDYTVSGTSITWLSSAGSGTGTGVVLDTTDVMIAVYES